MAPKVLLYDLETSANVGYTWGLYDQTVIRFAKEWDLLSVGWKWLGGGRAQVKTRADYKDKTDRSLTKTLWSLLDEADVVIGHNSLDFDNKKARARFAYWDLKPPSPWSDVDTCRVARSAFKFNSNKLDDLAQHLGLGRKKKTGGFDLWEKAMAGDKAALRRMGRYNRQDVTLLERVYLRLRPYIARHPNLALQAGRKNDCPNCGSKDVVAWGKRYTQRLVRQGMRCSDCGARYQIPYKEAA